MTAPISALFVKRFPFYQKYSIWIGWALCIIALGTGSLATELGGLIATQGLMYGLGFVILYWPIMSMVNEWWIVRKGFAFGLISSAAGINAEPTLHPYLMLTLRIGVAGAILPFVFQALLAKYGYKSTLRGTAIAVALLTGPLIPFCKGRLPASEQSTLASMDWRYGKRPLFWSFFLATLVQGLGLFFPAVFLPSYAADLGLKSSMGALLLSLMAMSQFCGQSVFGYLSDRQLSPSALAFGCCLCTSLSVFLLWGFARSLPFLIVFSLLHGFFVYGFSSMRSAMVKQLTSDPNSLMALQSILNGSLGVGNILVGPLSSILIAGVADVSGYGIRKYFGVVIFSGSCMVTSALILTISFFLAKQSKSLS
jgi:hypothetical protein